MSLCLFSPLFLFLSFFLAFFHQQLYIAAVECVCLAAEAPAGEVGLRLQLQLQQQLSPVLLLLVPFSVACFSASTEASSATAKLTSRSGGGGWKLAGKVIELAVTDCAWL